MSRRRLLRAGVASAAGLLAPSLTGLAPPWLAMVLPAGLTGSARAQGQAPQAQAAPRLPTPARRIISVGGGVTEIVYALGAGDELIATDTTSIYPAAALATRKVGYQRALAAEGLLSLAPTILLASHEAGPATTMASIEAAGVKVVRMTERHDFEGLLDRVSLVGATLDRVVAANALSTRLRDEWADTTRQVRAASERRGGKTVPVIFVLAHAGAPVVAGRDTAADALIRMAGGENPLAPAFAGYRPMTPEALVSSKPAVILTTSQGLEAQGGIDGLLSRPGMAATPAGRSRRLLGFDALYLLGFGPRLPQAVAELAHALEGVSA